jgi:serine/threonine protein phosphatase PrpC
MSITSASVKGKRDDHEDRVVIESPLHESLHFFAVLDGHGGDECVNFCRTRLVSYVREFLPCYAKNIPELLRLVIDKLVKDWDTMSLGAGFAMLTMDEKNTRFATCCDSGTTICCVMICSNTGKIWVANLGDSRCSIQLPWLPKHETISTTDHNVPNIVPEHILARGYSLDVYANGYVQKQLAMTHSIGDNTADMFGLVERDPTIFTLRLKKTSDICTILIATDGLYDETGKRQQSVFLNEHSTASGYLTEYGGEQQFFDNTSIILIKARVTD